MRAVDRVTRRGSFLGALALVASALLTAAPAGAQTTTVEQLHVGNSDLTGTKTTTTSADGRTVTVRTVSKRSGLYGVSFGTSETVVTKYDANHALETTQSTFAETTYNPDHTVRSIWNQSISRTYNALGGFTETFDTSHTGTVQDSKHTDIVFDAGGQMVSGTMSTTTYDKDGRSHTEKSHVDPGRQVFVADAVPAAPAPAAVVPATKPDPNAPTTTSEFTRGFHDLPEARDFTGTQTTTTSSDKRTLTVKTAVTGQNVGGPVHTISETVVRKYDKDHNLQSETSTTSWVLTYKNGKVGTTITSDTKTYNVVGGYSETIDKTQDEVRTHTEQSCDADGKVLSGTETSTDTKTGVTTKLRWDPQTQAFQSEAWFKHDDSSFTPVQPDTSTAAVADESVVTPPVSGHSGQIMVTYNDPDQPVHSLAYVAETRTDGSTTYLRGATDDAHHLFVPVPSNVTAISVFKGFDANGHPDAHAASCTVSDDAVMPGTQSTAAVGNAAAIVGTTAAYDLRAGTIAVQTQHATDIDALTLDDGPPLTTLAMSDRSMVAAMPATTSLGRHELSLATVAPSSGAPGYGMPIDVISLVVDPMPAVENVGDTATPTVHVLGLPAGDAAVMEFAIGGSAELVGGGTMVTVPVAGDVASCSIIGVRSGEAVVRFHLRVVSLAEATL